MSEPSEPMRAAIAAAATAQGRTSPNPWVGAVVVRNGKVIATGATSPYGGPHAEAAALANIDARGTTLYTTLEPCMPFAGKRTRPCTDVIVEAGVSRVVIGIEDPHAPVRGEGAGYLRDRGIQVEVGDGAEAVTAQLRPYLKFRATSRPYIVAKFATSLDGRVGAPSAGVRWLTSEAALQRAHHDRARFDAILVGSGTVAADDPALTARPDGAPASHQPVRIVLDGRGLSAPAAKVFGPGALVATSTSTPEWRQAVLATGAGIIELEPAERGVNLGQLLRILGQRSIVSLIVEGGPTVLSSFFAEELVDEVHAYVAPTVLGPSGTPLFERGPFFEPEVLRDAAIEVLHPDVLIRGYTGRWTP